MVVRATSDAEREAFAAAAARRVVVVVEVRDVSLWDVLKMKECVIESFSVSLVLMWELYE